MDDDELAKRKAQWEREEREPTPLPWRISRGVQWDGEATLVEICGANEDTVADNMEFYPHAIKEADAELIVRAVNAHEALVSLLTECLPGPECAPHTASLIEEIKEARAKAKQPHTLTNLSATLIRLHNHHHAFEGEIMTTHGALMQEVIDDLAERGVFTTGIGNINWVKPAIQNMSHSEVNTLARPLLHFHEQILESETTIRRSKDRFSSIYVISDIYGERSKIGMANLPTPRLAQLQTGNPNKLFIHRLFWIYSEKTPSAQTAIVAERNSHEAASEKYQRAVGEWFDCTPSQAHDVVEAELAWLVENGHMSRFCAMTPTRRMWSAANAN